MLVYMLWIDMTFLNLIDQCVEGLMASKINFYDKSAPPELIFLVFH